MANLKVRIIPNFYESQMEIEDLDTKKSITIFQSEMRSFTYLTEGYGEFSNSKWNKSKEGIIQIEHKNDKDVNLTFSLDDVIYAAR